MTTPEMQLDRLVWIDLETTGLDPEEDAVLEVGVIVTTARLDEVARMSWIFGTDDWDLGNMDDNVAEMHTRSGLWKLCEDIDARVGDDEERREALWQDIAAMIEPYAGSPMCGATVSFDRGFLWRNSSDVVRLFHYRNLDVSTLRLTGQRLGFTLPPKREVHRALPDLEDSIALMKAFVAQAGGWPDAPRSVVESLR